jgi:hypothetical protein
MSFAGCISSNLAPQHLGENRCVKGRIFHVDRGGEGSASLIFCEDRNYCTFTAHVLTSPDQKVDLRNLEGRTISIHGLLKGENGDAEMTLPNSRQLMSEDGEIPSFMKGFDVEERGHGSAGTSKAPRRKGTTTKKQTASLPISIPEDSEESGAPTP